MNELHLLDTVSVADSVIVMGASVVSNTPTATAQILYSLRSSSSQPSEGNIFNWHALGTTTVDLIVDSSITALILEMAIFQNGNPLGDIIMSATLPLAQPERKVHIIENTTELNVVAYNNGDLPSFAIDLYVEPLRDTSKGIRIYNQHSDSLRFLCYTQTAVGSQS